MDVVDDSIYSGPEAEPGGESSSIQRIRDEEFEVPPPDVCVVIGDEESLVEKTCRLMEEIPGFEEEIADSYVATSEALADFQSLNIMVCGKCRNVFHILDEFRSHADFCGLKESKDSGEEDEGVSAVALTLWSRTVKRLMAQNYGGFSPSREEMNRKIQERWYKLGNSAKEVWLEAAKRLVELGRYERIVFGANKLEELIKERGVERRPAWLKRNALTKKEKSILARYENVINKELRVRLTPLPSPIDANLVLRLKSVFSKKPSKGTQTRERCKGFFERGVQTTKKPVSNKDIQVIIEKPTVARGSVENDVQSSKERNMTESRSDSLPNICSIKNLIETGIQADSLDSSIMGIQTDNIVSSDERNQAVPSFSSSRSSQTENWPKDAIVSENDVTFGGGGAKKSIQLSTFEKMSFVERQHSLGWLVPKIVLGKVPSSVEPSFVRSTSFKKRKKFTVKSKNFGPDISDDARFDFPITRRRTPRPSESLIPQPSPSLSPITKEITSNRINSETNDLEFYVMNTDSGEHKWESESVVDQKMLQEYKQGALSHLELLPTKSIKPASPHEEETELSCLLIADQSHSQIKLPDKNVKRKRGRPPKASKSAKLVESTVLIGKQNLVQNISSAKSESVDAFTRNNLTSPPGKRRKLAKSDVKPNKRRTSAGGLSKVKAISKVHKWTKTPDEEDNDEELYYKESPSTSTSDKNNYKLSASNKTIVSPRESAARLSSTNTKKSPTKSEKMYPVTPERSKKGSPCKPREKTSPVNIIQLGLVGGPKTLVEAADVGQLGNTNKKQFQSGSYTSTNSKNFEREEILGPSNEDSFWDLNSLPPLPMPKDKEKKQENLPAGLSIRPIKSKKKSEIKKTQVVNQIDTGFPLDLKSLIPSGFEMVRQSKGPGRYEYCLRKKSTPDARNWNKSVLSSKPAKVVEFGSKSSESLSAKQNQNPNVKTIILGKDAPNILPQEPEIKRSFDGDVTAEDSSLIKLTCGLNPDKSAEIVSSSTDKVDNTEPQMEEVTTTTNVEEFFISEVNHEEECILDPTTGILVDKDGNPLQLPSSVASSTSSIEFHYEQATQMDQFVPMQITEEGQIILPEGTTEGVEHRVISTHQEPTLTTTKVLLVLPGGQMILTDLTDEQCGQLNIPIGQETTPTLGATTTDDGQVHILPATPGQTDHEIALQQQQQIQVQYHQQIVQSQQPLLVQPLPPPVVETNQFNDDTQLQHQHSNDSFSSSENVRTVSQTYISNPQLIDITCGSVQRSAENNSVISVSFREPQPEVSNEPIRVLAMGGGEASETPKPREIYKSETSTSTCSDSMPLIE